MLKSKIEEQRNIREGDDRMPVWTNRIDGKPTVAVTIVSIVLLLAIGFLMTRITKLPRLPNVTALYRRQDSC